MPVGVFEVDATATVPPVDPVWFVMIGVGPVRQGTAADPGEDLVELDLGAQEGVALRLDGAVDGEEVESGRRAEVDDGERSECHWCWEAEDRGHEHGRLLVVVRADDGVVEDGHGGAHHW